jgi:hypothetical protein
LFGRHLDAQGPADLLVDRRDSRLEDDGRAALGATRRGAQPRAQGGI